MAHFLGSTGCDLGQFSTNTSQRIQDYVWDLAAYPVGGITQRIHTIECRRPVVNMGDLVEKNRSR